MKRPRKWLWGAVAVLALVVAAWFGWGGYQAQRFDERLAALRAAGTLQTWADLSAAAAPSSENGWAVLEQADALRAALELAGDEEGHEHELAWLAPRWAASEAWSAEERADAKRYIEQLADYFERIDEALTYRVLSERARGPFTGSGWWPVLKALELLRLRACTHPSEAAACISKSMTLLALWEPRWSGTMLGVLWRPTLGFVRDVLASGRVLPADAEAWEPALARAEVQLLDRLPVSEAFRRALRLAVLQAWRQGQEPLEEFREALEWSVGFVNAEDKSEAGPASQLARAAETLRRPWYAAWWGRPRLHREALDLLETWEGAAPRTWNLEALRAAVLPSGLPYTAADVDRWTTLHTVASMRLARVALAVRRATENGMGSALDLRVGVAARLGGQHLYDALGDELFLMEEGGGEIVLQPRPSPVLRALDPKHAEAQGAELEARLALHVLLWRVPLP